MTVSGPPQTPLFRVTLFYGPEPVEGTPGILHCVFNVKKRSWKAGIQVIVEVSADLVSGIAAEIRLDAWLSQMLASRSDAERSDEATRAHDALAQILCLLRLERALEAGLTAENQRLPATAGSAPLVPLAPAARDRITAYIATELDLAGS